MRKLSFFTRIVNGAFTVKSLKGSAHLLRNLQRPIKEKAIKITKRVDISKFVVAIIGIIKENLLKYCDYQHILNGKFVIVYEVSRL